jgi:hypothetical protein
MFYKLEGMLNRRDLQGIGSLGSIGLTMVESHDKEKNKQKSIEINKLSA